MIDHPKRRRARRRADHPLRPRRTREHADLGDAGGGRRRDRVRGKLIARPGHPDYRRAGHLHGRPRSHRAADFHRGRRDQRRRDPPFQDFGDHRQAGDRRSRRPGIRVRHHAAVSLRLCHRLGMGELCRAFRRHRHCSGRGVLPAGGAADGLPPRFRHAGDGRPVRRPAGARGGAGQPCRVAGRSGERRP